MKRKHTLKEAGVLLLAAVLVFSSVAAMADTNDSTEPTPFSEVINVSSNNPKPIKNVLYDNNVVDIRGLLAAQEDPPFVTTIADDFEFDADTDVYGVFLQGGYWNLPAGPKDYKFGWNITFWDDNSGQPGNEIAGPFMFTNTTVDVEYWFNTSTSWYGNHTAMFDALGEDPVSFDADTKYWMSVMGVGVFPPQSGWAYHNLSNGGIKGEEAKWWSDYFAIPPWTNVSDVIGTISDANFQLLGPEPEFEITIAGLIGVTATVKNVGTADATNVEATTTITGGIMILPAGGVKTQTLGDITIGASADAKTFCIGLGLAPTITVNVTCDEGVTASASVTTKFIILFIVLI